VDDKGRPPDDASKGRVNSPKPGAYFPSEKFNSLIEERSARNEALDRLAKKRNR
jgi:hypothetical protein